MRWQKTEKEPRFSAESWRDPRLGAVFNFMLFYTVPST
jgi:hypothetical protein